MPNDEIEHLIGPEPKAQRQISQQSEKDRAKACLDQVIHENTVAYTALRTLKDQFFPFMHAYEGTLDGRGLSLCIEHKENPYGYLKEYAKIIHPGLLNPERKLLISRLEIPFLALYFGADKRLAVYASGNEFKTDNESYRKTRYYDTTGYSESWLKSWQGSGGPSHNYITEKEATRLLKEALAEHIKNMRATWASKIGKLFGLKTIGISMGLSSLFMQAHGNEQHSTLQARLVETIETLPTYPTITYDA